MRRSCLLSFHILFVLLSFIASSRTHAAELLGYLYSEQTILAATVCTSDQANPVSGMADKEAVHEVW